MYYTTTQKIADYSIIAEIAINAINTACLKNSGEVDAQNQIAYLYSSIKKTKCSHRLSISSVHSTDPTAHATSLARI